MSRVCNLIQQVEPSPTLTLVARAAELRAAGADLITFTVGEPDMDTPKHVKDAAKLALDKGYTKYTPVNGIAPLREAIVKKLKSDQGLDYGMNQIIVTNGGKHALAGALAVLLNPGDEVVIPAPYWTSYPDMVKLVGGVPRIVQTQAEDGYVLKPEQLRSAINSKTKVIIINTPSNPTGACYSADELKAVAEVVRSHPNRQQLFIITDEVYEPITFGGFKHVSIATLAPDLLDNIIIVNAFSKTYSMTGWRLGYAAGPRDVIDAMAIHQSQFTSSINSIAQHAAAAAYSDGGEFPRMMAAEFQERMHLVAELVGEMKGINLPVLPRGAFYAFMRVEELIGKRAKDGTTIKSASDFVTYLLEKFGVMVVQGEAFGDDRAFRISFACDRETLKKGLSRIAEAAASLE